MYQSKSTPAPHQRFAYDLGKDLHEYGYLYQMGLGKSKSAIDCAGYLYSLGRINTLVILAPNGVQRKWLRDDIPFSLPDYIEYQSAVWKSGSPKHIHQCESVVYVRGNHFRIIAANIEALISPKFQKFLENLLRVHTCMMVIDEAQTLKNPNNQRSKLLQKFRPLIPYRRILTGTSAAQSPLDLFGQFRFLNPDILGDSQTVFKAEFAHLASPNSPLVRSILQKNPRLRGVPQIVLTDDLGRPMYKNLDKLRAKIDPYCAVVRKEDVGLEFPQKVYVTHSFSLAPEQQKIYTALSTDLLVLFDDDSLTTVTHRMTLTLRLQQVANGFLVVDGEGLRQLFDKPTDNPRIKQLLETLEEVDDQAVIFCRFRPDVANVMEALKDRDDVVTYHGGLSADEREANYKSFQSGNAKIFVATIGAGHRGLDLPNCTTMIYYSNVFSNDQRAQSEDRIHRMTSKGDHRLYIDIVAENTIDEHILAALQGKVEVEKYLMRSSDWVRGSPPPAGLLAPHIATMA